MNVALQRKVVNKNFFRTVAKQDYFSRDKHVFLGPLFPLHSRAFPFFTSFSSEAWESRETWYVILGPLFSPSFSDALFPVILGRSPGISRKERTAFKLPEIPEIRDFEDDGVGGNF